MNNFSQILNKIFNKLENYFFITITFFYCVSVFRLKFFLFFFNVYKFSLKQNFSLLSKLFEKNINEKYFSNKSLKEFESINFLSLGQYHLYICYIYSRIYKNFKTQLKIKNILKKKLIFFPKKKSLFFLINTNYQNLLILNINNKNFINFKNFIKGKKIAIVGPKKSNNELGKIIDNYDIVVRTNFFKNSNRPYKVYGKKTSIAYFNSYRVASRKEKILEVRKTLDWLVFKSERDLLKVKDRYFDTKARVANIPDNFFFFSYPMAPQIIVHDLLHFQPLKIKLFHFDFYYSAGYNKAYKDFGTSKNHIANSLREHGGIDCFLFLKKLYENKFIEIDKATCSLKLPIKKYIEGIDKIYGEIKYLEGH